MTRTEKTYNLVLGTQEDGSVVVLDYVFRYGDRFEGATGSILRPVSQEEIYRALVEDEKTEWYEEIWRSDAGSSNGTEKGLAEWVDQISDDEYIEGRFEEYRTHSADDIAATLGVETPARYELIGIGRVFLRALGGTTLIDSEEVRAAVQDILLHETS